MIVKDKKKNIYAYTFVLTVILSYFTYLVSLETAAIKSKLQDHYFNFYDSAMALDLGFSSLPNIAISEGGSNVLRFGVGLFKKIPDILTEKLSGFVSRPFLDVMYIDIKFKDYQQLLEDREKAMRLGILYEPNKVNAKIRYKEERYKAKIRLKGDLSQHWRSRHRMSLRISLKGKNSILGFKKFSLQKVQARQFPYDHVFQSLMRQAGNLSPVHKYIRVFVNGEPWGIMNLEEHMSKELLEKQGRKDSIIVKFGNEKQWYFSRTVANPYSHYRISDPKLHLRVYSEKKYLKNKMHREWLTYLSEGRLMTDNAELYSIDRYARAFIMAKIWNSTHTLAPANSRHYFNPYLLKLEPITTDQDSYSIIKEDDDLNVGVEGIYRQISQTEKFKNNFSDNYRVAMGALKNIKNEFRYAQSYFPVDNKIGADVINRNMKILDEYSDKGFVELKPQKNNVEVIKSLPSDQQAKDLIQHLEIRHYEDGELKIYNLLPDTVRLEKLVVNESRVIDLGLEIPGYLPGNYVPFIYQTQLRGIYDKSIIAKTNYRGNSRSLVVGATLLKNVRNPLLMKEVRSNHKFLGKVDENNWKISRGSWNVDEPVVIRGNLFVEEGVVLTFSPTSYIIVIGSIHANGTSDSKIVFTPQKKEWKGIYVIGDGSKSSELRNVVIRSTSRLEHDMLSLTGGVTFYDVDLILEDVLFDKSYAEDALNLVKSKYVLKNVRFNQISSDALDSDFSSGRVTDSYFNGILGDALDFSGSYCGMKNLNISEVRDKGISVGEKSEVVVDFSKIGMVGVGIAVKDGSRAIVSNSSIRNYTLHAAMTYSKKGFYDGESRLDFENTELDGDSPFAVQKQTKLLVDGVMISSQDIDVRALYQTKEMEK